MKELKKFYLFVHPPAHGPYLLGWKLDVKREEEWKELIRKESQDEEKGVLIFSAAGSGKDEELNEYAFKYFRERCFIDPWDESPQTMVILAQDLEKMFSTRGNYDEWLPYEIWSSNNARKYAEGLKKELKKRGFFFDPQKIEMEAFGNWTGCHFKYSNFLPRYLDFVRPAVRHPVVANFPVKAKEFVECITLDHHVQLYLFLREDGQPMAQFIDGLRAVWEPPHFCQVKIDHKKIELYFYPPNEFIRSTIGATKILEDGFLADVGDGCRPSFTTIVGKDVSYEDFKKALVSAKISHFNARTGVFCSAGMR